MSDAEILLLIEECMDIEEGTLKLDDNLSEYEEWDSLTALSIIATVGERLHITLKGDKIKKAVTVSDLVNQLR